MNRNPDLLVTLRQQLDGLRRTPSGEMLYRLIERAMSRYGASTGTVEQGFITFLDLLLTRCANDAKYDPVTRVKARLIQQRLALLRPEGGATPPAGAAPASARTEAAGNAAIPDVTQDPVAAPDDTLMESQAPQAGEVEGLAARVTESLAAHADAGALFGAEQQALNRLDSKIQDFGDLKQLLVKGLDDLIREREELRQKLTSVANYAKEADAHRQQLRAELVHARRSAVTDSLTGLPQRELFTKSLEAEVGRVKRYGFSMVLALLDIDNLHLINERHGREAGDAVLRFYAHEVLGNFRSYDLVARYDEDSFAVLFPNTQRDGAMRALEKVQRRVQETMLTFGDNSFPLPGFSSVLAIYAQGERPASLLKRAHEALAHARLKGRTVVSLPAG